MTQSKKIVEEEGYCQAGVGVSNDGPKGARLIQCSRNKTDENQQCAHRHIQVAGEGSLGVCPGGKAKKVIPREELTEVSPRRAGCTLNIEIKPKPKKWVR